MNARSIGEWAHPTQQPNLYTKQTEVDAVAYMFAYVRLCSN